MTKPEEINIIINVFVALGTVAVAFLAIWGDEVRARWVGPKLRLVPQLNLRGVLAKHGDGSLSIFYHLRVVNDRPTVSAANCRVTLKKMWRRGPHGTFHEIDVAVPLTLVWSPGEFSPPNITLLSEHVVDFGSVPQGGAAFRFRPCVYDPPFNFLGDVHANECVRYGLEIVSDNFVSPRLQVFEVEWDGQWNDDLNVMAHHLRARETKATTK